jgi:transposase InsO family protein
MAEFEKQEINCRWIYSDKGRTYSFRTWREAFSPLGLILKCTRPYTPRNNGKVERFMKTPLA